MSEITININTDELAESVSKVLLGRPGLLGQNPLVRIVATSIEKAEPAIRDRVQTLLSEFVSSPEFRDNMLAIYRDAMYGEASRLGRNAARAMVTAKPET